ncbi:TetR/AcrR family transcriptional regulator [Gordonia sp. CPCC 205333]|uniref:TetR/AcrR family transcriptional regulator n=1 Tax=Gordonia sp. CPCC 205333 TaxID=3140790 RepID=UPI003AF38F5F
MPGPMRGRPSSANAILDAALDLLDGGGTISIESVANAAGLTKPGLMYHFGTKAALMDALVDHVVDSLESELLRRLPVPADRTTAAQRHRAYLEWALDCPHRRCELVMFSDPRLMSRLTQRWTERFDSWVALPADMSPLQRARLHSARLIADGSWLADTTETFPLSGADRQQVLELGLALLEEDAS